MTGGCGGVSGGELRSLLHGAEEARGHLQEEGPQRGGQEGERCIEDGKFERCCIKDGKEAVTGNCIQQQYL
jgi:hypothetical protein